MRFRSIYILFVLLCLSCSDKYLDVFPEDKITSANFPENENDIKFALNGVYSLLKETSIYNQGLFGFGVLDGATPNAFNWGNTAIAKIGNGQLSSSDAEIVTFRWTRCYAIIFRANYVLQILDEVDLAQEKRKIYEGEAHFLRGLAYSLLADSYGGVPIIKSAISTDEAKNLVRASLAETWDQAIADYDVAIANLATDAPEEGRANKGAALALKMRAYLYQNKFDKVLEVAEQIEALGKYSLFSSYEGLFKEENENNAEVIFDVQYIRGENSQGSFHDQYCGTGTGSFTRGTRYVPTDDLVATYETIDGSPVDPENPYENRDPRLAFTVVLPGSFILGYQFPNYIYPGGAYNHPGNQLKHLSCRKYREADFDKLPPSGQSAINDIVVRYADVLLAKAEALIELNQDIPEAIALINRIRTEREDVKISELSMGLSQTEAREKLRHERRVEFALEGLYWSDIKRWDLGNEIYPLEIKDHQGGVIETRFPNGYLEYYDLLPIPASEISLNPGLAQNPNW
ncbi:RagB/SusD family nutrient uptake outer membrane protein [Marinilongibacter aquaticus]|uniref:RagB/SusD family nutrient uptake outer membrane protein n=1 Tax=Marinilongibacter aquaticus TaxID=2975157 RepID=UPI0021BD0AAF|nr:RagB/SusD family nutrient uptake outer membrane protein [Marinilongibacter aquaticus]UBM59921.1 RagB/SusD family nutrient uptake outer membrane protein [Marinilongibacter aquaticus]